MASLSQWWASLWADIEKYFYSAPPADSVLRNQYLDGIVKEQKYSELRNGLRHYYTNEDKAQLIKLAVNEKNSIILQTMLNQNAIHLSETDENVLLQAYINKDKTSFDILFTVLLTQDELSEKEYQYVLEVLKNIPLDVQSNQRNWLKKLLPRKVEFPVSTRLGDWIYSLHKIYKSKLDLQEKLSLSLDDNHEKTANLRRLLDNISGNTASASLEELREKVTHLDETISFDENLFIDTNGISLLTKALASNDVELHEVSLLAEMNPCVSFQDIENLNSLEQVQKVLKNLDAVKEINPQLHKKVQEYAISAFETLYKPQEGLFESLDPAALMQQLASPNFIEELSELSLVQRKSTLGYLAMKAIIEPNDYLSILKSLLGIVIKDCALPVNEVKEWFALLPKGITIADHDLDSLLKQSEFADAILSSLISSVTLTGRQSAKLLQYIKEHRDHSSPLLNAYFTWINKFSLDGITFDSKDYRAVMDKEDWYTLFNMCMTDHALIHQHYANYILIMESPKANRVSLYNPVISTTEGNVTLLASAINHQAEFFSSYLFNSKEIAVSKESLAGVDLKQAWVFLSSIHYTEIEALMMDLIAVALNQNDHDKIKVLLDAHMNEFTRDMLDNVYELISKHEQGTNELTKLLIVKRSSSSLDADVNLLERIAKFSSEQAASAYNQLLLNNLDITSWNEKAISKFSNLLVESPQAREKFSAFIEGNKLNDKASNLIARFLGAFGSIDRNEEFSIICDRVIDDLTIGNGAVIEHWINGLASMSNERLKELLTGKDYLSRLLLASSRQYVTKFLQVCQLKNIPIINLMYEMNFQLTQELKSVVVNNTSLSNYLEVANVDVYRALLLALYRKENISGEALDIIHTLVDLVEQKDVDELLANLISILDLNSQSSMDFMVEILDNLPESFITMYECKHRDLNALKTLSSSVRLKKLDSIISYNELLNKVSLDESLEFENFVLTNEQLLKVWDVMLEKVKSSKSNSVQNLCWLMKQYSYRDVLTPKIENLFNALNENERGIAKRLLSEPPSAKLLKAMRAQSVTNQLLNRHFGTWAKLIVSEDYINSTADQKVLAEICIKNIQSSLPNKYDDIFSWTNRLNILSSSIVQPVLKSNKELFVNLVDVELKLENADQTWLGFFVKAVMNSVQSLTVKEIKALFSNVQPSDLIEFFLFERSRYEANLNDTPLLRHEVAISDSFKLLAVIAIENAIEAGLYDHVAEALQWLAVDQVARNVLFLSNMKLVAIDLNKLKDTLVGQPEDSVNAIMDLALKYNQGGGHEVDSFNKQHYAYDPDASHSQLMLDTELLKSPDDLVLALMQSSEGRRCVQYRKADINESHYAVFETTLLNYARIHKKVSKMLNHSNVLGNMEATLEKHLIVRDHGAQLAQDNRSVNGELSTELNRLDDLAKILHHIVTLFNIPLKEFPTLECKEHAINLLKMEKQWNWNDCMQNILNPDTLEANYRFADDYFDQNLRHFKTLGVKASRISRVRDMSQFSPSKSDDHPKHRASMAEKFRSIFT